MTQWLFDLGNTRLKFAPLQHGQPGPLQAVSDIAADALPQGDVAHVASVADPQRHTALMLALAGRFRRVDLARPHARCAGVTVAYAEPHRLGVDRFLAMLGARDRLGAACCLIVGVGTAMTVDLLDAEGRHHGGAIAPSPTTMRQLLHARVPALPPEGGDNVGLGATTDDALASGCHGAALGLVDRLLQQAWLTCGSDTRLLLHGGGGEALLPWLPEALWMPDLVLHGLARWAALERTA